MCRPLGVHGTDRHASPRHHAQKFRLHFFGGASGRSIVDETFSERGFFFRADHFSVARRGVPSLLLMALGSCASITIDLYARRRKWPLEQVVVRLRHERVHAEDCAYCEDVNSMLDRIELGVELIGPLDEGQRARLLQIAEKCPVHRTLTSEIRIQLSARRREGGPLGHSAG